MSSAVQKIGINIGGSSTDSVSFSTLRNTFFKDNPDSATPTGTVKASDLLRTTALPPSGTQTSPIVPDATENSNIVTSASNWKVSYFQQSVKFYNINQTGTDLNYDIGAQSWNNNLTKNVVKRWRVEGTVGSENSSTAATFSALSHNLRIEVLGSILGYGGKGGGTAGAPAISGEKGGDALKISSDITVSQTYNTISGVDSNLLSLDVYYNSDTSIVKPVVIFIHGGAWAIGDKANVDSKATFFNNLGYVFVSVNYRLSPAANLLLPYNFFVGDNGTIATASTRVKHANHVTDCANAVTWVYNNISSYGGNGNKLVLMGHSAGATLASLLVTNQSYLTTAGLPAGKILGCISNDTESYNILQQILTPIVNEDVPNPSPITIQKTVMNAFGIYPDKTVTGTINNITTDFATKAAAEAVYATGSAILNISASTPEFLVLRRGPNDRIARETEFVTALQSAGRTVTAVSYPGDTTYTHSEINESIGAANDPPVGKTLPAGVSNVSTVIQNWITNLVPSAPALTTNRVVVDVKSTGKIYGGGGGGERGENGINGSAQVCYQDNSTSQGCNSAPPCPPGTTVVGTPSHGPCGRKMVPAPGEWGWGHYWQPFGTKRSNICRTQETSTAPQGGTGGNGAPGRGYNNQSGSLTGPSGTAAGGTPSCSSGFTVLTPGNSPIAATAGSNGGNGGAYGSAGGNTPNTGTGGQAGRAIFGSNYQIVGSTGSENIKGSTN